MIKIEDATILDILPDTFSNDEIKAFAATVQKLTTELYGKFAALLFWGDIENASPVVLDAMAAELHCPFYTNDMTVQQKRSIIASTFVFNSQIGTVSAMTGLLSGAFGNGSVSEWYEYGGAPYHFKAVVNTTPDLPVTRGGYEMFENNLDDVAPKRARLDKLVIRRDMHQNMKVCIGIVKTKKKIVVLPSTVHSEERGYN